MFYGEITTRGQIGFGMNDRFDWSDSDMIAITASDQSGLIDREFHIQVVNKDGTPCSFNHTECSIIDLHAYADSNREKTFVFPYGILNDMKNIHQGSAIKMFDVRNKFEKCYYPDWWY